MNIDTVKAELIDWIAQLNDQQAINKLLSLKNKLSTQKSKPDSKIYGSGKHLINEPMDMFKVSSYEFPNYLK